MKNRLCMTLLALSIATASYGNPLDVFKSNPSFILCTTKNSASDPFPVVRVMYLSKMNGTDGNIDMIFYEAVPKPASQTGHSEHFLVMVDATSGTISGQIPLDDARYPDCLRGTSLKTLANRNQSGTFALK